MSSLRLAALALVLGVVGLGCFSRLDSDEARHYSCKTTDDCTTATVGVCCARTGAVNKAHAACVQVDPLPCDVVCQPD